jgi:LmbE family N-acetylglucosaminyl deacetylase
MFVSGREAMRFATSTVVVALTMSMPAPNHGQAAPRTLVAVYAHPDDEGSAAPVLARYAREGVQVYVIVATDGAQGGLNTPIPRGPELARVRSEEMQCAAKALGAQPPVYLGFPDGELGHYPADPARLVQLAMRLHAELQRLRPDVLVTWGADGGPPHPDHKLVSNVVTQLVRAGAPGVPERLFYAYLPAEGMRVINPARGAPPFAVPLAKYFTVRVPFTPADFDAARRSMSCHRTQYSDEVVLRVTEAARQEWNGVVPLIPLIPSAAGNDLFATR